MAENRTTLVTSAHAADVVWRCGGAIALRQEEKVDVTAVCRSYGERGESAKLWKPEGRSLYKINAARRKEVENAANALGARDIQLFDLGGGVSCKRSGRRNQAPEFRVPGRRNNDRCSHQWQRSGDGAAIQRTARKLFDGVVFAH